MNNKENSNIEDRDLIIKSRNGDELARETILRKYKVMVSSICRPFFLSGGDDEDLTQEGLIALNSAIDKYNLDSKALFSTFAYTCVHNKIIDLIRQTSLSDVSELTEEESDGSSVEYDIMIRQLVSDMRQAVLDKGTKSDIVIFEMFLGGSSYKEIADKIGKDSKFVDNKLQRIKKIILKCSIAWK